MHFSVSKISAPLARLIRNCALALAIIFVGSGWALTIDAQEMIGSAGIDSAPSDRTLHILRPVIHAEQDDAELCLEFDHVLAGGNYGRVAANLRLEVDGKTRPLSAKNISVNSNLLCIVPLEHRRDYHIALSAMRGAEGEKLPETYSLSFTVPDRKSSLAFIADRASGGVTRWLDIDPVLRLINVPKARLELYRITDPAKMAEAWRQRLQTTLAPTESAYFARHNGQLIWRGDTALPNKPNKVLQQTLSLRTDAGNPPPGLYLLIASMPESEPVKPDTLKVSENAKSADKDKAKSDELTPLAAEWLLRSDLRLGAYTSGATLYGVTEKIDGTATSDSVKLTLYDPAQKTLAEAESDNHGLAQLTIADAKTLQGAVLLAQNKQGDVDCVDIDSGKDVAAPSPPASLTLDKKVYLPDEIVKTHFNGFDSRGRALPSQGTIIKLFRPDNSLFASFAAGDDKNVPKTTLAFNAPAQNGIWSVAWQKSDGVTLAQSALRVTTNPAAPYFTIAADRALLDESGNLTLTIKSLSSDGVPQPYLTGRLSGIWRTPEHPFADWGDYHFGNGDHYDNNAGIKAIGDHADAVSAAFITDDKGVAILRPTVTPPADNGFMQALALDIEGGAASGAAGAPPFSLRVQSRNPAIGIKPLRQDSRFPENSLARFAVIALDGEGKRVDVADLSYQIFEEGRSFDWYQAEGHWAYKQQQQQRLLGGGQLSIGREHDATIEWPVTAGSYHLDILDDAGHVVARHGFGAGWSANENTDSAVQKLAVNAEPAILKAEQPTRLNFNLAKPAVISVIIADDHIRQIIHQAMPAGQATVSFTPQSDWGHNLALWVDVPALNAKGMLLLTSDAKEEAVLKDVALVQPASPPTASSLTPAADEPLTVMATVPQEVRMGDRLIVTVALKNHLPKTKEATGVHYAFTMSPGIKLANAAQTTGILLPGQSRDITLDLEAVREGAAEIRLDVTGAHNLHLTRLWPFATMARDIILTTRGAPTLEPQQSWQGMADQKNQPSPATVFIGSQPLLDMPGILTSFLDANPFTSHEIAASLDVLWQWHSVIVTAGILPEKIWQERRRDLLLRLLQRQKNDGSFADFPHRDGDIDSTAAALTALAHSDDPMAQAAMTPAVDWLNKILGNTWFDEKERPMRATAYAAMAEAGKLDIASLYYFADISLDKSLPPVAAAQLALAFAKLKDREKTMQWIDRARPGLDKADGVPQTLALLTGNMLLNPEEFQPSLQRLAESIKTLNTPDFMANAVFLTALSHIENHAPDWHVDGDGESRTGHGVGVFHIAKTGIRNTGDRPLFLTITGESALQLPAASTITRHVYRMNGALLSDRQAFDRDATYAIVLEGTGLKDHNGPVFIRDDVNPLIAPITCALEPNLMTSDALAWLRSQPPTTSEACEISPRAVDIALAPASADGNWRIVYLARAKASGFFRFSPPMTR
jgi:uncharacterized protein YfaS (alpha-2-macroglobulin family)